MPDWNEDGPASREVEPSGVGLRRAALGSLAGVALLIAPVGLAQVLVEDEDADVATGRDADTLLAALQANTDQAEVLSQTRLNQALAAHEVVVAPKPAAATTTSTTTTTTTTTTLPDDGEDPPPDNGGGFGDPGAYETWDALADCETGGNWSTNTGNGYYGGIQFSLSTWQSVGGTGYPYEHSREEQIYRGQILQARAGWGQWPACSAQLGLG